MPLARTHTVLEMIEVENTTYLDRLHFLSKTAPDFERTESLLRGFKVRSDDEKKEITMNDLGVVMKKCKEDIPDWDIEFAQKRNCVFQWRNSDGQFCFLKCMSIDLPFIVDNKPAERYDQHNLFKPVGDDKDITLFMKDDVDYKEMERLIVLSRAFTELGFQTIDWIYLN